MAQVATCAAPAVFRSIVATEACPCLPPQLAPPAYHPGNLAGAAADGPGSAAGAAHLAVGGCEDGNPAQRQRVLGVGQRNVVGCEREREERGGAPILWLFLSFGSTRRRVPRPAEVRRCITRRAAGVCAGKQRLVQQPLRALRGEGHTTGSRHQQVPQRTCSQRPVAQLVKREQRNAAACTRQHCTRGRAMGAGPGADANASEGAGYNCRHMHVHLPPAAGCTCTHAHLMPAAGSSPAAAHLRAAAPAGAPSPHQHTACPPAGAEQAHTHRNCGG